MTTLQKRLIFYFFFFFFFSFFLKSFFQKQLQYDISMSPDLEIRYFHVQVEGCLNTLCFSLMVGHLLFSVNNSQGEKPHPISLHHPTIPFPLRSCFGFIPNLAYLWIELPVMEQFVRLPFMGLGFFVVHGQKYQLKTLYYVYQHLLKLQM